MRNGKAFLVVVLVLLAWEAFQHNTVKISVDKLNIEINAEAVKNAAALMGRTELSGSKPGLTYYTPFPRGQ